MMSRKGSLYLGYFSVQDKAVGTRISIAIGTPTWALMDEHLWGLKPDKDELNKFKYKGGSWEDFAYAYLTKITQSFQALENIQILENRLNNGENITVFCWEAEPTCHRFLLGLVMHLKGYTVYTYDRNLKAYRHFLEKDAMLPD